MNYATLTQLAATDPLPLRLGARAPREDEMPHVAQDGAVRRNGEHYVYESADGKMEAWPAAFDRNGRSFGAAGCKTHSDAVGLRRAPQPLDDEIDF